MFVGFGGFLFVCLFITFLIGPIGRAFCHLPPGLPWVGQLVTSVDVQPESIQQKSRRCLGVLQGKKAAFSFPSWLTSLLSY